ncbi:uncharacterized protein [Penaeus vannamei]|uniref:uncharacterized protein n=1 Tax=Penaeus vannamei TaxID=6689 RepID=UPI00387F9682
MYPVVYPSARHSPLVVPTAVFIHAEEDKALIMTRVRSRCEADCDAATTQDYDADANAGLSRSEPRACDVAPSARPPVPGQATAAGWAMVKIARRFGLRQLQPRQQEDPRRKSHAPWESPTTVYLAPGSSTTAITPATFTPTPPDNNAFWSNVMSLCCVTDIFGTIGDTITTCPVALNTPLPPSTRPCHPQHAPATLNTSLPPSTRPCQLQHAPATLNTSLPPSTHPCRPQHAPVAPNTPLSPPTCPCRPQHVPVTFNTPVTELCHLIRATPSPPPLLAGGPSRPSRRPSPACAPASPLPPDTILDPLHLAPRLTSPREQAAPLALPTDGFVAPGSPWAYAPRDPRPLLLQPRPAPFPPHPPSRGSRSRGERLGPRRASDALPPSTSHKGFSADFFSAAPRSAPGAAARPRKRFPIPSHGRSRRPAAEGAAPPGSLSGGPPGRPARRGTAAAVTRAAG